MAILNFDSNNNTPARRTPFSNLNNPSDRPKAKVWLNIGYEKAGKFINLPIGMPLDTMEPAKVSGQNEEWIKIQTARNALLEALQALGANLKPGEEIDVSNLTIKIRHVAEEREVKPEENEFSMDLGSLLAIPTGNQIAAE